MIDKVTEVLNNRNLEAIQELYHSEAVLIPLEAHVVIRGIAAITDYYKELIEDRGAMFKSLESERTTEKGNTVTTGVCHISWMDNDCEMSIKARVSLLEHDGKIIAHHFSDMPFMHIEKCL